MKRSRSIIVTCLLITCLKDLTWKFNGSGHNLDVRGVSEFEEAKLEMNCAHMEASNVVSRRRLELCQRINNTINQLANGVIFYYSPVFPHHLEWESGQIQYMTRIPAWWYAAAALPQTIQREFSNMDYQSNLPLDVAWMVASYLQNPSRLVISCPAIHRQVQISEPRIVAEIAEQWRPIAELRSWYGHQVWTRGRPAVQNVVAPQANDQFLAALYERWDQEEERAVRLHEERYEPHIRLARHMQDAEEQGDGWYQANQDELRWYTALNFYEQSVEEAITFGERVPRGVIHSDDGTMRLFFSESDSESETEVMGYQSE
jgi:hypothetical protein